MRIALTGGTGFVGRQLISQWQSSHQLRCIARDVDSAAASFSSPNLDWMEGDLGEEVWQGPFVEGCEAVVHSGLWRSSRSFQARESDLVNYLRINLLGTIKLIEASILAGVKRFIFVSTCSVHEEILSDRELDETHPLWAKSHYGAHKAAIEKFVHSYGLGTGFPICAIRPTGIYGMQTPVSDSKWFPLIKAVVEGRDVEVSRGGKEVHVVDVARAIDLLLNTDANIAGQAYACYDRYVSEFDVATIAKQVFDSESQILGQQSAPRHQIVTRKIRELGMTFGGEPQLKKTVEAIGAAAQME